jgi:hypothetical protein
MPLEQPADPLKSVASAMATAAEAVRDGASDAAAKVQKALPATGEFVSRFVYSSCYFVSYGVVFPTLFLANAIPGGGPIAAGLADGASAASDFVKEMRAQKAAQRKSALDDDQSAVAQEGLEALDNC